MLKVILRESNGAYLSKLACSSGSGVDVPKHAVDCIKNGFALASVAINNAATRVTIIVFMPLEATTRTVVEGTKKTSELDFREHESPFEKNATKRNQTNNAERRVISSPLDKEMKLTLVAVHHSHTYQSQGGKQQTAGWLGNADDLNQRIAVLDSIIILRDRIVGHCVDRGIRRACG